MIKTKIKKAIAIASIVVLTATTLGTTFAASQIGTGSVIGDVTLDTAIIWDNLFPGTASGQLTGIVVKAQVLPTLNMTVSTGTIDLGILVSGVESTGSLDIEIGTNAANGVTITVRSGSGGLTNTSNNALQINNLTTDGIAESYTFTSATGAIDSSVSGFLSSVALAKTEISNNTTENTIYSTNKPEQDDAVNADLTFIVSATTNAETAAGNYQDILTFTVTGNF